MTINNLDIEIETRALETGSYIEAINDFCDEKGIEQENIVELLNPILLDKVKVEFYKKNWFPEKKIKNSLDDFI
jgi:Phage late-transcription coactivator